MRLPKFLLPEAAAQVSVKCLSASSRWSAQRETNSGNQVAEIVGKGGERKYALWQPSCQKWEEKKKLWQPSCQNLGKELKKKKNPLHHPTESFG